MDHRVFTREQIGLVPPTSDPGTLSLEEYGVVHHIGSGPAWPANPAATLRSIQEFHMETRGYADIAYNAAVDRRGNVYQLRWGHVGAATYQYNQKSFAVLGICNAVGAWQPTPELLDGIAWTFNYAKREGILAADAEIVGHGDLNVGDECPGKLEQHLHEIKTLMAIPPPLPPVPDDDEVDMLIIEATGRPLALLTGNKLIQLKDVSSVQALKDAGVKQATVTGRDYDLLEAG